MWHRARVRVRLGAASVGCVIGATLFLLTIEPAFRSTFHRRETYEQYTKGLISRDFYQGVTVQTIKTYGPAMLALDMWLTPGFRQEIREIVGS